MHFSDCDYNLKGYYSHVTCTCAVFKGGLYCTRGGRPDHITCNGKPRPTCDSWKTWMIHSVIGVKFNGK